METPIKHTMNKPSNREKGFSVHMTKKRARRVKNPGLAGHSFQEVNKLPQAEGGRNTSVKG